MTIKKLDYSKIQKDIFYQVLYPLYSKEFVFGDNYENFIFLIESNFILNSEQLEYIKEHWELKESILTIENL